MHARLRRPISRLLQQLPPGTQAAIWSVRSHLANTLVSIQSGSMRRQAIGAVSRFAVQHLLLPRMKSIRYQITDRNRPAAIDPKLSLIVINRNGEQHLHRLLPSLLKHEADTAFELIVVDHGSSDNSVDTVLAFGDSKPLSLLQFSNNNTFAHANNIAAQHASGEVLVFINNDIILDQAVLQALADELASKEVGVAGLPLYFPTKDFQRSDTLQHNGICFEYDPQYHFARPGNLASDGLPVLAVTAAFMACRKIDFDAVGGFCSDYVYGYEDVDLCLNIARKRAGRSMVCHSVAAIHNESASQTRRPQRLLAIQRRHNIALFDKRQRSLIKALHRNHRLHTNYSSKPICVGLVVSDDNPSTAAGDYFTAMELAEALHTELGWSTWFLAESASSDWYDVSGLDVLIVLLDHYKLNACHGRSTGLLTIAWLRNWFDRWCSRPWIQHYDLLLSSSRGGLEYAQSETGLPCRLFPIATNEKRFTPAASHRPVYASDYCFTGSYWGVEREIEGFHPQQLPFDFALFGDGWQEHEQFSRYYRGFVSYQQLPEVYAGTNILIDDANHVTKPWGSVNSRVFDGLAAGALVLSNGELGVRETFSTELPCYQNSAELEQLIHYYMQNAGQRQALAANLRNEVLSKHTYSHRARRLRDIICQEVPTSYSIAIKIGVPERKQCAEWGDYHFATALQKCFLAMGRPCRVDILPEWYSDSTETDEVVLVLRGLSEYKPRNHQINLLWLISHPDKCKDEELNLYDHIFVASNSYTEVLRKRLRSPVSRLLQCTDSSRFHLPETAANDGRLLFVGNSRKQYRPIVQHAIDCGEDLHLYGTHWSGRVPSQYIRGEHLANETLPQHYAHCEVLLNDHWPGMRDMGFYSNRLFDAAACGATVVSDRVEGMDELFDGVIYSYDGTAADLQQQLAKARREREQKTEQRQACARRIAEQHSFAARAQTIDALIHSLSIALRYPQ